MEKAPQSAPAGPAPVSLSRSRPAAVPAQGPLAQLAAMVNSSPRVQSQFRQVEEIRSSDSVRAITALSAAFNTDGPPVQPRRREEARFGQHAAGENAEPGSGPANESQDTAQRMEAAPNRTGLPDQLKAGMESLSGLSLDDVNVHYNSSRPAQLSALAYAQGPDIHIAPGQEKHLPHEAWHVVQQKQGRVRPTMQMKGGVPVNDDRGLEHEADVMGERAAAFSGNSSGNDGHSMAVSKSIAQRKVKGSLVKEVSTEHYPEAVGHIHDQIGNGSSQFVTIDRPGAKDNRKESLKGYATQSGLDRDEWPMAMFSEGGSGAHIEYIDPSDNRGAGSSIGVNLRAYPDGTVVEFFATTSGKYNVVQL